MSICYFDFVYPFKTSHEHNIWQPQKIDRDKLLSENADDIKLERQELDVCCLCKAPECMELTTIDERGNNLTACKKHYIEYKTSKNCMKNRCPNKTNGIHLYCSTYCQNIAKDDKKEDLFWLPEVQIIRKYQEIINMLRSELYKTKMSLPDNKSYSENILSNSELLDKKILNVKELDIYSICKVQRCFEITQNTKGQQNPICYCHYLENKKYNICMEKNCKSRSIGNHLYCSNYCAIMAISNKQTEFYNIGEINIIQKYNEIIQDLRNNLQKTKYQNSQQKYSICSI